MQLHLHVHVSQQSLSLQKSVNNSIRVPLTPQQIPMEQYRDSSLTRGRWAPRPVMLR